MKGKVITGFTVATLVGGIANIANATVYVVPPDIDQYKQKTDQTYTDLYKNPQSPIRRGITEQSLQKLDTLPTPNAILQNGADIKKSADAVVQGKTVAEGTELKVVIDGTTINMVAQNGEWKVQSCYGSGSCTQLGTWVKVEKNLSGWSCVYSGKYGCEKEQKNVRQELFNAFTGEVKVVDQKEQRTRSCSKYGCSAWSSPQVVQTLRYQEGAVDIAQAITNGVLKVNVPIPTSGSAEITERKLKLGFPVPFFGNRKER